MRAKITTGAVTIMAFCAVTSSILLWITLRSVSDANLAAVTRNSAATASSAIEDIQRRIVGYANSLARRPEIAIAVSGGNVEALREMLVAEFETLKALDASVTAVEVTSRSGSVMVRGHDPSDRSTEPASPLAVREALSGQTSTGLAASPSGQDMAYSAVVPLQFAGMVVGTVTVGSTLGEDTATQIHAKTGAEIVFFFEGRARASTLAGEQITRMELRAEDLQRLSKDEEVQRTSVVAGERYEVGFVPLRSGDGKVASVMAVYVSRAQVDRVARNALLRYLALLAGALVVIAWVVVRFANRMADPLATLTQVAQRIATRDLRPVSVLVTGDDEIHRTVSGMATAIEGIRTTVEAIARHSTELGASSRQQSDVSRRMLEDAERTSSEVAQVSSAAEQMSASMSTAATAVEEMQASIGEIARNTVEAAAVAEAAVRVAEKTTETINSLGHNSQKIDKVVQIITSIAEQTNLLALNATIESARAGEAGRGFSVVANEVKELARQTASATGEIEHQIHAIQSDSENAVKAIAEISSTIGRIHDVLQTIAVAVEQQTSTTSEIGGNVTEVADGSRAIARSIASLSQRAEGTSQTAETTKETAAALDRLAVKLQDLIAGFRY